MVRYAKRIKRGYERRLLYDFQSSLDFVAANRDGHSDVRQSKRIKRCDDDETRCSLEVIPDDLLATEILPRLADSRTVVHSSAVCQHWRSLLSAADFIPNFNRRHRSSHAMFVEFRFHRPRACSHQLWDRHLIVDGSKVAAGETADYDFATPIEGHRGIIDSACDDFLLLSRFADGTRHIHIRNAVSGRRLDLPDLPVKDHEGFCALVSDPNSTPSRYSFRAVYINFISADSRWSTTVFSSETGRWSDLTPAPDIGLGLRPAAVSVDGLLFLLYKHGGSIRLVMFDASKASWRFLHLPADFLLPGEFYRGWAAEFGPPEEVERLGSSKHLPLIGER